MEDTLRDMEKLDDGHHSAFADLAFSDAIYEDFRSTTKKLNCISAFVVHMPEKCSMSQ